MGWTDSPWLGFDTETTGVAPASDRLVTAALVLRAGGATATGPDEERTWLADPGVPIPEAAASVHGVTTERARAEGRPAAEVVEEVASTLADHWRSGWPVVVFNAPFDLTLMDAELARHGLASFEERLEGAPMLVLDPLVLDRGLDRFRKGKRTLGVMTEVYGAVTRENAHTAEVDVAMTLDVLAGIARRYPAVADHAITDMQGLQADMHRRWAENFEQWLRSRGRGQSISKEWPRETRW